MSGTFTYLSLGAGVQSTALLAMVTHPEAAKRMLSWQSYGSAEEPVYPERPDVAVFADTQAEPAYVYEHLERLRGLTDIPIQVVSRGNLASDNIGKTRTTLPYFTASPDGRAGIALRKCTVEYKVIPIQQWVRQHLGYTKGQRVKHRVRCMVGISIDEIQRVKPSQDRWIERVHPLVDAGMRRADCLRFLEAVGWPIPKKSACVFCPYHDDATWRDLRDNYPEEFAKAVEFDKRVRSSQQAGLSSPVFLHRSLRPLDEVEFRPAHTTPLFDSFTEECEGMCGV